MTDKIIVKLIEMDAKMDSLATKEDLRNQENRIVTTVDGFTKLHETLDHELIAMRNKYDRLEERLAKLEHQYSA